MGDRAYIYWLPKRRTAAPTLTTTNARATQLSLLILLLSLAWLACVVSTTTLTESGHGLNGHGVPQTTDLGDDDTEETVLASLKRRAFQVWNRARDNLPTSYYFDFEQFVKQFKRNYYDASEAYFRRSVFMRKAVEIFQNHIKLRLGLTGLRLAVNKFSDRTRVEFNRMYQIVRPSLLFLGDATDAGMDDKEEEGGLRKQKQRQESDDEADQLLDIYSGPAIANLGRKLDSELQGKAELEARIEAAVQDEFLSSVEPPVKLEATSLARDTTTEQATTVAKLKPMRPRKLPKPGRLKSPPDEHDHNHDELMMAPPYEPPRLEAHQLVGLDWSRHACFHEIYEQEPDCGNCYVIAATSVAEFYSCSEGVTTSTGSKQITRIKFSKDYVLQCAQKFVPTVMGCLGGSIFDTVRFIAIAGANKVRSWKTKREKALLAMLKELGGQAPTDPLDIGCPLDPDVVPIKEWGSVRVRLNPVRVHPNHWLEALEDGPLLVSVQMPPDGVDSYSGGVHNGQGCESSALFHAMVLVGYGLNENGEPYWRFRNSFGPDWGDRGHFHLSMAIPAGCIVESIRIYREPCKSCEHWS